MQYGYRIVEDMKNGLMHYMEEQGVDSLGELVGIANQNIIPAENLDRDYVVYPDFDTDKCIGCGACLKTGCPALQRKGNKVTIDQTLCNACGLCAGLCPKQCMEGASK